MSTRSGFLVGLVIVASLLSVSLAEDAKRLVPADPEKFHLFLLVGQSNMAGRGKVSTEDKMPHPRVLMLNKNNEWVPAVDPLHFDKAAAGTGLGKTFAIALAEANPDVTIGLVPCAVGGSPISAWEPGAYDAPTKSHPWDDALVRAKLALKSGTLKGILWHQGESDASAQRAPIYGEKLTSLVQRFRTELNAPSVPFLVGQIGEFPSRPWNDFHRTVDAALKKFAQEDQHAAYVSSAGLDHNGDSVHFDAASYREFGKRYAEAFLKLNEAKSIETK